MWWVRLVAWSSGRPGATGRAAPAMAPWCRGRGSLPRDGRRPRQHEAERGERLGDCFASLLLVHRRVLGVGILAVKAGQFVELGRRDLERAIRPRTCCSASSSTASSVASGPSAIMAVAIACEASPATHASSGATRFPSAAERANGTTMRSPSGVSQASPTSVVRSSRVRGTGMREGWGSTRWPKDSADFGGRDKTRGARVGAPPSSCDPPPPAIPIAGRCRV